VFRDLHRTRRDVFKDDGIALTGITEHTLSHTPRTHAAHACYTDSESILLFIICLIVIPVPSLTVFPIFTF